MSKNNARKYVFGSRSAHVSNFGSAVTHCDGRSRNHRNYISRRADCFESVRDRIDHEVSRNSSLASFTRKRKYSVSEHVLQRNAQRKYHEKINLVLVATTMRHLPEVILLESHGMDDQTKTGPPRLEERP